MLRRMCGDLFVQTKERKLDRDKVATRRVERVRRACLRMQLLGREATAEFEEGMRKDIQGARKVSKHAYAWMARVIAAGPARAAWLRELQLAEGEAKRHIRAAKAAGEIDDYQVWRCVASE